MAKQEYASIPYRVDDRGNGKTPFGYTVHWRDIAKAAGLVWSDYEGEWIITSEQVSSIDFKTGNEKTQFLLIRYYNFQVALAKAKKGHKTDTETNEILKEACDYVFKNLVDPRGNPVDLSKRMDLPYSQIIDKFESEAKIYTTPPTPEEFKKAKTVERVVSAITPKTL